MAKDTNEQMTLLEFGSQYLNEEIVHDILQKLNGLNTTNDVVFNLAWSLSVMIVALNKHEGGSDKDICGRSQELFNYVHDAAHLLWDEKDNSEVSSIFSSIKFGELN